MVKEETVFLASESWLEMVILFWEGYRIVDKVIATKEQVRLCGKIPAYATSLSVTKVGLDAKHWYEQDATIPFNITFSMSPLDKRTRGYTPQYIKELQTTASSEW